jgi:hypothetical protein
MEENDEYEVKSAFVYNFTKYIDWEDPKLYNASNFRIAVYKDSPLEIHLSKLLQNKKIKNKKVEVVKFSLIDEIEKVHIIFVPNKTNTKEFKEIVDHENSKNALIISEKQGRLSLGSGINFLLINNRIKFEVNLNVLKQNNLKTGSQLLKLAEKVEQ